MGLTHGRYFVVVGSLFTVIWVALAIEPVYRADWALENVLVVFFVFFMVISRRSFQFSRVSITLIFLFLCIHSVGAHYTYARVPYDDWIRDTAGVSLNEVMGWQRNHYDRFGHFFYGLLLAYPIREIFLRVVNVRGFWGYFLPLDLTMSTSMIFELLEWGAASIFGGDLGVAYLGAQGDIWDAHWDMALASLGALITMVITAAVNMRYQRDFAQEWSASFKVKQTEPLGETALVRMLNEQDSGN